MLLELIEERLGNELSSLNGWMVEKSLSNHLGKTAYILFGAKSKLRINSGMKVTCGETNVAAKASVRYLEVDLDQSLDGKLIVEAIPNKR